MTERIIVEIIGHAKGPFQVRIEEFSPVLANGYGPCAYSTPAEAIARCIEWHLEQEYGAVGHVLDALGGLYAKIYCAEFPPAAKEGKP